MKCKNCGAPLEAGTELCPYCGTPTPWDEAFVEEKLKQKLKQKEEAERRERLAALPQVKRVSGTLLPFLYILSFFFYAPYWYATRLRLLNRLSPPMKLPAWAAAVLALSLLGGICTTSVREYVVEPLIDRGVLSWEIDPVDATDKDGRPLSPEEARAKAIEQEIFEWGFTAALLSSAWLAFRARRILQSYTAKHLGQAAAVVAIAPSGTLLFLFGPLYLQCQVNKMIAMELLTPKI